MTIKMNKKDIVYQELKKKIISNEITPGSSIHEADFANMLGVSKIPIREALRQLENDGLVENISGRGTKVCEITIKNIRETFEIREIIECGVVRYAALMENKENLVSERKNFEKKVQDKKKTGKSKYKLDPYDDIHYAIVNEINNDILSNLYKSLNGRIERIRNYFGEKFNENRLDEMPGEHLDILDSIIAGDAEKATKLMGKHLRNALNYIVQLALYK